MSAMPQAAPDATPEDMVKQFREFLLTYNKVTEMCFDACVHDFKTRKIGEKESGCVSSCMEKYLKLTQRIATRFAEHQVSQNEGQLASIQQQVPSK